ncbi:MAG TPA: GIY-YIG nuclease family protein [Pyrinomonadaceae bacterium]|nr:GIY-YIG nuclease family protein [Pyrinomonadaceae bacterium]
MSDSKMKAAMNDIDLDELREELSEFAEPAKKIGHSAAEQRIVAGFEEIERFVDENQRLPQHGDDRDIFERLYAVRLDRIRESAECRDVLKRLDSKGLLGDEANLNLRKEITDEELLSELSDVAPSDDDLTRLVHVRSREEIKSAEEIAKRNPCEDFEKFKPVFETVLADLESGKRETLKYENDSRIRKGDLFILDGQTVLVAEEGESFRSNYDRDDWRLRVIYSNGTESDLLMRSLQRALNRDKTSRRIIERSLGPLFAQIEDDDDLPSGYIYVLRSMSEHPFIAEHRSVVHKIGVTGGDVKARLANAKNDSTYLLADVEIIATFKLANINAKRLEALIHKFFASARLDLKLKDRFGIEVESREWFLLPITVIEDAIEKITDGSIGNFRYDPESGLIVIA